MSRSEPLVDWIEIHDTIVAVMKVDANTNRISFEARPLQPGGRFSTIPSGSGARSVFTRCPRRSLIDPVTGALDGERRLDSRGCDPAPREDEARPPVGPVTCRDATEIGPRSFAACSPVDYSAP